MRAPVLVITLSEGTLSGLGQALDQLGAAWVRVPLLRFSDAGGVERLQKALASGTPYQGVALTSRRSAAAYAAAVGNDRRAGLPVWVTGHGTAAALRRCVPLHVVETPAPDGAAAELARMMLASGVRGPILFPCGERHHAALPMLLREAGVPVDEVTAYVAEVASDEAVRSAGGSGRAPIVGSAAVAEALARVVPAEDRGPLVALGPTTARAAAAAGWEPSATADEPTIPALLQTLHGVLRCFPSPVSS